MKSDARNGKKSDGRSRRSVSVLAALLLVLVLCGNKCDPGEARLISSASGKVHGKRIDDLTLARLLDMWR
jgi:hypothetical protein